MTRCGSFRKLICQAGDDGMIYPLPSHSAANPWNMIGKLASKITYALNESIGINVQLSREFAPMMNPDISQTVFAAELHRQFDALDVDVRAW